MRKLLIATSLLVFLGACSEAKVAAPSLFALTPEIPAQIGAEEGPRLHLARRTVDFGEIWQGAVREVVFPLISSGTTPLHIKRVHASCGCTVVESRIVSNDGSFRPLVYEEDLPPGTRVEIVARFDSRDRDGYEKKTVEVYSDDPLGGHTLEVGVTIKPWLLVSEDPLAFGRVFLSEPVSKTARITSGTGASFALKWKPKRELPPGVSIALSPDLPGASSATSWTLTTTLEPGVPMGVMMIPLMLESDVPLPDIGPVESDTTAAAPKRSSAREDAPSLDGAPAAGQKMDNERPLTHFFDEWVTATVLAPIAPDVSYMSFGFLRPDEVTSTSVRIECYDPEAAADFFSGEPVVRITDPEGGELKHASKFTPTMRRITPESQAQVSPKRALLPGSFGAWDLEVSALGFRGEGENRLGGRVEVSFPGAKGALEPIVLIFQVILQP